jgi:hypothetical protein
MPPRQRAQKPSATATATATAKPIPPPFGPAPASLAPLLSTFNPDTVYIVHTDAHPAWFKKRIFTVPVVLNVVIALVLAYRAYTILPFYWAVVMSVLGNPNHTTITYHDHTWLSLLWKVTRRMLTFFTDYILVMVVAPWPWGFFIEGPGNPVRWRWAIGFRDSEIIVRQSRGWGAKDLLGDTDGSTGKAGIDSPFFKTRILPAIDPARLREKTGYLLMDGSFDLDFYGMIAATKLIDRKDISAAELRKSVFVYVGEGEQGQWTMWECDQPEVSETEARNKVIEFRDRLAALGKENLFYKWVELIQYESNAPGGFTPERQVDAVEKVKRLFQDHGVDWDTFSSEIEGLNDLPAM